MKIHQLSLFLENRTGQLNAPIAALAKAGINIVTLCLADSQQFGILRLIVQDWQRAREVLTKAGFVVNVTEVLALDVEDRPGGLAQVLTVCETEKLSIEYMYAFTDGPKARKATLVFRFEDPDLALRTLEKHKINAIGAVELFGRGA
jgi:hypothetical protein